MADKRLKLVSNAPIYKDVRSLLNEILEVTPEFPRQYKYTIGGEMQKLAVSLLHLLETRYVVLISQRDSDIVIELYKK